MLHKDRIEEIFKETGALMEGHFILTSGRHSKRYLQSAKILQYPNFAEELAKGLAEMFLDYNIDIVIGPAVGGIILAYEIARQLGVQNLFAERENGKMTLRRGFSMPQNANVLVVEDIISTGGTVQEVIDLVTSLGAHVAGVAALVDRSMGVADFGMLYNAAYTVDYHKPDSVITYSPDECPMCKEGLITAVKPGNRVTRG